MFPGLDVTCCTSGAIQKMRANPPPTRIHRNLLGRRPKEERYDRGGDNKPNGRGHVNEVALRCD